jgi:hypothetical protein
VTLVVVHCNDLTVLVLKMYKAAALLSALTVYTVPCHDRGHINVMLVLQSNTDSLHTVQVSPAESHATSSEGVCDYSNVHFEEDVEVIAVIGEAEIGIKREEIPEVMSLRVIKVEPDVVSYVCVCVCDCY